MKNQESPRYEPARHNQKSFRNLGSERSYMRSDGSGSPKSKRSNESPDHRPAGMTADEQHDYIERMNNWHEPDEMEVKLINKKNGIYSRRENSGVVRDIALAPLQNM